MEKFKELYKTASIRFKKWNYSGVGKYFITVCTKFHESYFGEIIDGKMYLNNLGKELEKQWHTTPEIRPDMNIFLDEFQIMPNHFHGIIKIGWNEYNSLRLFSTMKKITTFNIDLNKIPKNYPLVPSCRDAMPGVSTIIPYTFQNVTRNSFGPQHKNLASILRGLKSSITIYARNNQLLFDWQSGYHDIIIRNDFTLNKIRDDIRNNPKNWDRDRFNN